MQSQIWKKVCNMKRVSTIIKQIEILHRELVEHDDEEIKKAILKLEKGGMQFGWIVDAIYQGLDIDEDDEE